MRSYKNQDLLQQGNSIYVYGAIIVGAGPSGLATSACLKQHGVPSIILEKSGCIGSLWRHGTYDRLKLHLPKQFCQLPLLNFPTNFPVYPTKDQFISYIENYASHFKIEINFNQTVENAGFDRESGLWGIRTQDHLYMSRWLVVATGENAEPVIPEIVGLERFQGDVIHSSGYRSGLEFRNKNVLVVGCGNSGMEVSFDLWNSNAITYMVVRNKVHILPKDMFGLSTFGLAMRLLKWLPTRLVDKILLLGAKLVFGDTNRFGLCRPKTGPLELKNATGKTPVLDVGTFSQVKSGKIKVYEDSVPANSKIMKGVEGITKTGAKFVDGQEKEFDAIIMATGYKSNVLSWLKSDDFTDEGLPKNKFPNGWKGQNGLYIVGFSRRGLLGSASDAINIAKDIFYQSAPTAKLTK